MKRFGRKRTGLMAMLVVALLVALVVAAPAAATERWSHKYAYFSGVAGETLAIGDVVCVKNADGLIYKADANAATLRPAVGLIGHGGASGERVQVVQYGILAGQAEMSTGYRIFLSETAGALTATAPTNAQVLGFVMPETGSTTTSTTYFIQAIPETSAGAGF